MSVRKKHVDPVRQREGAESIQKSENWHSTASEDLHRRTGVNQSASVSCTDISKRQNTGKFTSIDPDVLESMLESTADDLLKVFHTSHEKNESEMNTKRRIKGELQNLTDYLLSAGGTEEFTKQPHQAQSQAPELIPKTSSASLASRPVEFQIGEPSTVTINDQEVNKETLELRVNSQIGKKRFHDSVDTSETPAKIPHIQTTKNTKRSLTKSQFFTPKSDKAVAGPLHSQKSLSDKKPTLETPGVPLRKQSGGKPQDRSTLQRRFIQKTLFPIGDKTDSTNPIKPSVHPKSQKSGQKRKRSPSMKTKQSSAGRKRVRQSRCSKEEKHLCPICSKPDCGKCNNCLNKSSHKACVEKPIEECRKYAQQSVSFDQSFKATTDTFKGTNSSLRDSHASEGSSSSTQPTQQVPCSPIQRLTNSETYSSSSHFSEDIDNTTHVQLTQPSQQAPCSSEIETELLNNSETNPSSGDNSSSQHDTIKQPQPTEQAPQSNEVHSELPTEVVEELSDTSATITNPDSGSKEDFHSQIDKALKHTNVKIFTAKCGVFGPPETGKSHFKALVCNKKRPIVRQSTAIAEDAVQITNYTEELVEMHRTRDGSTVRWFVTDNKKIASLVANTMYDRKNPINLSVDKKRRMTKTRQKLLENMTKLTERELKRNPKGLKGMRLIYLVDTGGQPQFQEILPMFVRSSSVHFIVHKLNESLDESPRFDYQVDGVKYSIPEEMLISNRVYLQQSLRTISSCNFSSSIGSTPKPHVAVIGMFKDKCDNDLIDAKQKAVTECIAPFTELKTDEEKKKNEPNKKNKCFAITPTRHTEKPIFAIDGSEEGWATNGKLLDKIHITIESVTDDLDAEIPLRWFLFLNLLNEGRETKRFLSLEACYKLAKDEDILMDEDNVNKALEMFDELNLVLHFRKFLPNVVFVSTRFLLDKVTKIIVQSFNCASDKADITPEERLQFRKTGIIDKSTIKRVKAIEEGFNDVFKFDDLFELLENLCIFAKLSHTCNCYFVPCVLALEQDGKKSEFLQKISEEMHSNVVEPLVISFSDGYSPRGLFCASISYLMKYWKIESESRTLVRKRNLVEFNYLQEKEAVPLGSVVIVDHTTRFEVYSTCNREYLREIRRTIYEALWYVATKCLDYSPENIDISFGFTCDINCGITYRHGTHTSLEDKDDPQWTTKCIKNKKSKHGKPLNDKQRPWFYSKKSDVASTTVSDNELTLKLLLNKVASRTNKWQKIAFQLDFQPVQIERIEIQENRDIDMCFQKMFTRWQRLGKPQFTWKVIIDALKSPSVEESQLADELSRKYLS